MPRKKIAKNCHKKHKKTQKLIFDCRKSLDDIFSHFKFYAAKVHQKPVPYTRSSEISEDLSYVFGGNSPHRLDFNDQALLDKQICMIVAKQRTVLIINLYWKLFEDFLP